jgi:hypothetical protein
MDDLPHLENAVPGTWYDAEMWAPDREIPVLASLRFCITPYKTIFLEEAVMYWKEGDWFYACSGRSMPDPYMYVAHWMSLPQPPQIMPNSLEFLHSSPVRHLSIAEDVATAMGKEMIPDQERKCVIIRD